MSFKPQTICQYIARAERWANGGDANLAIACALIAIAKSMEAQAAKQEEEK